MFLTAIYYCSNSPDTLMSLYSFISAIIVKSHPTVVCHSAFGLVNATDVLAFVFV